MSREVVERLRRAIEAFNRGDFDEALRDAHPDLEWSHELVPANLEGGVFRGPDEVKRFWRNWAEIFEDFRLDIEELVDTGDHVVMVVMLSGRAKQSGVDIGTPRFAYLCEVEGDRATRVVAYPSKEEALAAIGRS
jgi:ketosteroid isomerase-like protein